MDTYPNDGKFSNDWLWYGMAEFYLLNGTFKNLEKRWICNWNYGTYNWLILQKYCIDLDL
jgi:hypothetical protein